MSTTKTEDLAARPPALQEVEDCTVVIVVKEDEEEEDRGEVACRICHLSWESGEWIEEENKKSEMIEIGCGCKNELGLAHRHCAETWFRMKGNRICEICGVIAENITGNEDSDYLEEWHGNQEQSISSDDQENWFVCGRGQSLCNLLMAFLVVALTLPWFYHQRTR